MMDIDFYVATKNVFLRLKCQNCSDDFGIHPLQPTLHFFLVIAKVIATFFIYKKSFNLPNRSEPSHNRFQLNAENGPHYLE